MQATDFAPQRTLRVTKKFSTTSMLVSLFLTRVTFHKAHILEAFLVGTV